MKVLFKTRFFSLEGDRIIWLITIFLCSISLIAVYSAGGGFLKQLFYISAGLSVMFVCSKLDYRILSRISFPLLFIGLIVLISTIFMGDLHNGARRSLFGVQTFYFIGLCVIIFFAQYLTVMQNKINSRPYLLSAFFGISFICILMIKDNFSTAVILFTTVFILFFISEIKLKYLFGFVLCCALVLAVLLKMNFGRTDTGSGRFSHYTGKAYNNNYANQIEPAKAAIATTGLIPAGPGKGILKNRIPEKDTDYIYAVVFEELGSLVGILILLLYIVFFTRVWLLTMRADGAFARFLTAGIGFWICTQAIVHIGVSCELLPVTGQTLPFISRGGASIIVSGAAVGMLLSISKTISKKEKPSKNYGQVA